MNLNDIQQSPEAIQNGFNSGSFEMASKDFREAGTSRPFLKRDLYKSGSEKLKTASF